MRPIERRRFLQMGLQATAITVGGTAISKLPHDRVARPLARGVRTPAGVAPSGTRRLVVIEMSGGNDGLSMVVPYADDRYTKLRPRTAVNPHSVLRIDEHVGFNPELRRLARHAPAIIAGVGVAKPDLSHFEMMRRWWTADPDGTDNPSTGFLGRLCDAVGSPAAPAVGVTLGGGPTPALNAEHVVTLALDPSTDGVFPAPGDGNGLDTAWRGIQRSIANGNRTDGPLLTTAQDSTDIALRFSDALTKLPKGAPGYPKTDLGTQLRLAARLLDSNLGIRVIHVSYGADFDTHDNHTGRYPTLMRDLDAALGTFLTDVEHRGLAGEVLVATTSEFGRRVPDNGSSGLDHGAASTALVFGPVSPGVHGEMPSLRHLDDNGNLIATVNMNDYYATLAQHWLGIRADLVLSGAPHPLEGVIAV